jgi:CxC2 like cysteine cluster associated with KDZ transposases
MPTLCSDYKCHIKYLQGIQAAQELHSQTRKAKKTGSTSLHTVNEKHTSPAATPQPLSLDDLTDISDTLFKNADCFPEDSEKHSKRTRTLKSGNPLIMVVNQSGVFDMDIVYCICPNAGARDEQLLSAGIFPSTFKQIEAAFTFSVLDDFLMDNLECKTTAQQYYSKIQLISNWMFPDSVPVCVISPHICLAWHADQNYRIYINSCSGHPASGAI